MLNVFSASGTIGEFVEKLNNLKNQQKNVVIKLRSV